MFLSVFFHSQPIPIIAKRGCGDGIFQIIVFDTCSTQDLPQPSSCGGKISLAASSQANDHHVLAHWPGWDFLRIVLYSDSFPIQLPPLTLYSSTTFPGVISALLSEGYSCLLLLHSLFPSIQLFCMSNPLSSATVRLKLTH